MTSPNSQPSRWRLPKGLRELSAPYWIVSSAIVLGMIVSLVVGVKAKDPALLKTFQQFITPVLTFFGGGVINDIYSRLSQEKRLSADVNKSAYSTLVMLQNVLFVENRLTQASDELNENHKTEASTSVQVALAMITMTLRQVAQNLRLWGSLSTEAVDKAKIEFAEDAFIDTLVSGPTRQQIEFESPSKDKTEESNG
jgi:hypothetical protein